MMYQNGGDRAVDTTRAILDKVFGTGVYRDFSVRLWDGSVASPATGQSSRFTLVLTHPGSLRRMFWPPGELSLAEAYLAGDFDIEGDIFSAMNLASRFDNMSTVEWLKLARQVLSLPKSEPPQKYQEGRQRARLTGARHSRDRDKAAISYHYDVGNEFYALFLGHWMAYSCAYFKNQETNLDSAQAAKFEHICRKLRLKSDERVLDIGCGWGGFEVYAAERYNVDVLGITLSEPQVEYGRNWIREEGLSDRAHIELRDYRDMDAIDPFDKIVSIGMFEHVGRSKLSEYFTCAWQVLKAGGLFLNHGIAAQGRNAPNWFERTLLQRGQFIQRYVFPDGELVPISDALTFAENIGFEVRDVESLREHYALTLRNWVHNLEEMHERAVHFKDERTYRTWRMYLAASAQGFVAGQINVFQSLLAKNKKGIAGLPLTRADLYRNFYG